MRRMIVRFVPPVLRDTWSRFFGPPAVRRIINTGLPTRYYANPRSRQARVIGETGHYEVDTEQIMREHIKPGSVVLDIGANEGILASFAGTLVGDDGMVIAIEPQDRLQDVLEINLAINHVKNYRIYHNALGGEEGASSTLHLYPETNLGQSGLVKKPRRGWTTIRQHEQQTSFVSPDRILRDCAVDRFDFVKVDVEGFEHKVVEALLPKVREGKVRKLLLDYHTPILESQGVDPKDIHQSLIDAGMKVAQGDTSSLWSYVLYEHAS